MYKLSKRFAKIKADEICKDFRDAGGTYTKRYSEIRLNPPTLRIKLFAISHNFTRKNKEVNQIIKYLERRRFPFAFIYAQRSASYVDSFAFSLPLKKL